MFEMKDLQAYSRLSAPLLTAYVDSNPGKPTNRGPSPEYVTWLNSARKAVGGGVPPSEQKLFLEQWERVQAFFRDCLSPPRGALIFAGTGVWEFVPLEIEVESELHWGRPLLFPLLGLVGRHEPCVIVVVDRAGARFFHYRLGEMAEVEERKFEIDISKWRRKDLGKVARSPESSLRGLREVKKSRGSARDAFERRKDEQYRRLCGEIAERARELSAEPGVAGLFLVGSERLVEPIAAALPEALRPRVVTINEDLGRVVSPAIEERIGPAVARWERARRSEMVDELLGDAAGTLTGLDAILAELQQGKLRRLVVAGRFDAPLRQCLSCGWTDRAADDVCPACGGLRRTVSLRESLPDLAWSHGAEIEVVGNEESARLVEAGGIAARLRQAKEANMNRPAAQTG